MAAPPVTPDLSITERLEQFLDEEAALGAPPAPSTPKEDQPTSQPEDTLTAVDLQTPADPPADETDTEAEGEAETETEGTGESTETEEETDTISTLDDLAGVFEVEPTVLLRQIKVTGREGEEITLEQALDGYRQAPLVKHHLDEIEREKVQMKETHEKTMGEIAGLTHQLISQIEMEAELPKPDESLKETDPVEYSSQLIRRNEEIQRREERRATVKAALDKMREQEGQQAEVRRQEEAVKIVQQIPEWQDPKKAETEIASMEKFLLRIGFTPEALVEGLTDAPSVYTAYLAWKMDEFQSKKPLLKEKAKPKILPSGQRRDDQLEVSQKKRNALKGRLARSGKIEDAAELLLEHIE